MTWKPIAHRAKPSPSTPLIQPEQARAEGRCDCPGCGPCWEDVESACGLATRPGESRCEHCQRWSRAATMVRHRGAA